MDEKPASTGAPGRPATVRVWAATPIPRRRRLLLGLLIAALFLACLSVWFLLAPPRGERAPSPQELSAKPETAPALAPGPARDVPPPDYTHPNAELAEFLARRVDVQFAGAYPHEVAKWLWSRTGLEVAMPGALAGRCYFTLKAQGITLREILERLATAGHFQIEYHNQTVVLWDRAADTVLSALAKELETGGVQARCEAVCDLAALADPRIYPLLFRALEDPDDSVFHWTTWVLEAQHLPTLGFGAGVAPAREALDLRLGKLLSTPPQALRVLGATRLPQAAESLTARLAQARPTEWVIHARALAATRRPEAIPRLSDAGPAAPLEAHRLLVEMGTPAAREALVQLCLSKPGPMAAEGEVVEQVHDPRLVEAFLPLLKQDAGAFRKASDLLAPYRDRRATAAVLARVRKGGFAEPWHEPQWLLTQSGDQEAYDLLAELSQKKETENAMLFLAQSPFPEGIRRFFALAKSPNQPGARWHTYTIVGIYYMTEPSGLAGLKELAATDDKQMRGAALSGIGALPGPDTDAYVLERVVNGGPEERAALLARLPQARRACAGELILEALKRDPLFRATAAELAAKLPPVPKMGQVVRLLGWDPDTANNWAVNEWLARVSTATPPRRERLDRAATFANHTDAGVRARLAALARDAGHARLWPVLLTLVQNEEPTVRCAAWDALRVLPDPRALRAALAALNDVEPNVRGRAVRVLAQFGKAEAVEPLLGALRDKEKVVVSNAAFALAELRDQRVAPQFVSALRGGGVSCAQAQVCQALGRRAEMAGLRFLEGLLHDGSVEQKVWAYQGLNENGWPAGLPVQEKERIQAAMRDFHKSAPKGVKLPKPPQFTTPQTPPTRPPPPVVIGEDVEF